MTNIVIADVVRSAVGRAHKGSLAHTRPDEVAGEVIKALLGRVPQVKPEDVDDLIMGCAFPEGSQGSNTARSIGFLADLPEETPAMTINRFCSSGLQAIALAAGSVAIGSTDVVVAGGVESMTSVPMTGFAPSVSAILMEKKASAFTPMGTTAEIVAQRFEVAREVQDELAYNSQQKAAAAQKAGKFDDEIVPVTAVTYKGQERVTKEFKVDEMVRAETTLEGLAKLRPAFAAKGSVTAGNASPLSDGAAAALVMTEEKAKSLGIKPLAYLRSFVSVGVDPAIMGIGPVPAIRKLLAKNNLKIDDISVFEVNEAFAAQAAYVSRELPLPAEKVNVNGGAIALGHPLGCTGAKLTATLLYELKRRGDKYGVVSMCIGGGMGAAALFELIK